MRNRIGVDWNKTVIVLTFADYKCQSLSVKILTIMRCSTFLCMWRNGKSTYVRSTLLSEADLPKETACSIVMFPMSGDCDECLPTNIWLGILQTLHTILQPMEVPHTQMKPSQYQMTVKVMSVGGIFLFCCCFPCGCCQLYICMWLHFEAAGHFQREFQQMICKEFIA